MAYKVLLEKDNSKIAIFLETGADLTLALLFLKDCQVEIKEFVTDVGASAFGGWEKIRGLIYYKEYGSVELIGESFLKYRDEFNTN